MSEILDAPVFSADRAHRYTLPRTIGSGDRTVAFIMLNPSTADETQDDPTIRRCIGFARAWDFDRLIVGNLFAFRATDPREMKSAADPIGPDNDRWLLEIVKAADLVVCAWGQHGHYLERAAMVSWMLRKRTPLHAIELAKDTTPKHPLYLRGDLRPMLWRRMRGIGGANG